GRRRGPVPRRMSAPGRLPARIAPQREARSAVPPAAFSFPVRVYYEDTDAAGVVYYAHYLKFMERARTEWLSALGFSLAAFEQDFGAAFVVRRLVIDFLAPARLNDTLHVTVEAVERGAS